MAALHFHVEANGLKGFCPFRAILTHKTSLPQGAALVNMLLALRAVLKEKQPFSSFVLLFSLFLKFDSLKIDF